MRKLMLAALAISALAGCLDNDSDLDQAANGLAPEDISPYGNAQTTESEVDTGFDGATFVATQMVTFTNGFDAATLSDISLSTFNGDVNVKEGANGSYEAVIHLEARGMTPDQAESNLDAIQIQHDDSLSGDTFGLEIHVGADDTGNGLIVLGNFGGGYQASIYLTLPSHVLHSMQATTGNGDAHAHGLNFANLALDTGNGDAMVDGGQATAARLTTGNGDLYMGGHAGDLHATSGNGDVFLKVTPTGGSWTLETGNGDIQALVADVAAYRIQASTGNGEVAILLADNQTVYNEEGGQTTAQSDDFDTAAIQVTLAASTGNGDIHILEGEEMDGGDHHDDSDDPGADTHRFQSVSTIRHVYRA